MYKRTTVSLPAELVNELDSYSIELAEKKSQIVAAALKYYFDQIDFMIAENRIDKLNKGQEKLVPADQVWKEFGL